MTVVHHIPNIGNSELRKLCRNTELFVPKLVIMKVGSFGKG